MLRLFLTTCLALTNINLVAYSVPYQGQHTIIGQTYYIVATKNLDHFRKIPQTYNVGFDQFLLANPQLKNHPSIQKGQVLTIPKQTLLPKAIPANTILINIADKKLYYYHQASATLFVYPVGIGRSHTPTPLGKMRIVQKRFKPVWHVTSDGLKEAHESGNLDHPKRVPPGPDNPLGEYAIHLSKPNYLIHGTNQPEKIGTQNTAGCINLYPEHIAELYPRISLNTVVEIINQPIKMLKIANKIWRETHPIPLDNTQENSEKTRPHSKVYMQESSPPQHLEISVNQSHGIPEILMDTEEQSYTG